MPTVRCPSCGKPARISPAKPTCACGHTFYFPPTTIRQGENESAHPAGHLPTAGFRGWSVTGNLPLMLTLGAVAFIGLAILVGYVGMLLVSRNAEARRQSPPSPVVMPPPPAAPQPPPPPVAAPEPQPAPPTPPRVRPFAHLAALRPIPVTEKTTGNISDAQIQSAIEGAVNYLLEQFGLRELRVSPSQHDRHGGMHALALYSLLHAGKTISDPRLSLSGDRLPPLIDHLKKMSMDGGAATYSRSLRIAALGVHNRTEDRSTMAQDLDWLLKAHRDGAYGYRMPAETATKVGWDNSNSQYGVLGVWAAAESGLPVPQTYWDAVEKHWADNQNEDGGWSYKAPGPRTQATTTMTSAGITSLFVARDQRIRSTNLAEPLSESLRRGIAWMEQGDHALRLNSESTGYSLFGTERAALASGMKYFGEHDWYRELGRRIIASQQKDGSWLGMNGEVVETAFRLLFLCRGRPPIFVSKLQFGERWNTRPRDIANLVDFAGPEMERSLNWQIVNIERNWRDWLDSPVLFMGSDQSIAISENEEQGLRSYIEAGGLLFTHADFGSTEFSRSVGEMSQRLFPHLRFEKLDEDHPVYSMVYPIEHKPDLYGVSNGSRLLWVHSPADIASRWDSKRRRQNPEMLRLGVNIAIYASGRRELRYRLETPFIAEPESPPIGEMPIARLRYDGNWNPEPGAWPRMGRWMHHDTSISLPVLDLPIPQLREETAPVAHLTGTSAWSPTDEEIEAIRNFVHAGGVLLVDPSGGGEAFSKSIHESLLARAFPNAALMDMDETHPLLNASTNGQTDVRTAKVRSEAAIHLRRPPVIRIMQPGKGYVIVMEIDLASGFLGTRTSGIIGYTSDYSMALARNLLLWAAGTMDD